LRWGGYGGELGRRTERGAGCGGRLAHLSDYIAIAIIHRDADNPNDLMCEPVGRYVKDAFCFSNDSAFDV
jgi:hypothetical protein